MAPKHKLFQEPLVRPPTGFDNVVDSPTDPDPGHGLLSDLWHGAKGGVVAGVENTIEAAGLLPGVPEFDLGLRENLRDPQGMPGKVTEAMFQFATGFLPAVGILGKIGKLGKLRKLAPRSTAGKLLQAVGEGAASGAIADFLVFPGDEEKLSDLLVMLPGMEDSVFQYLAADPSDGEAEGRLKNVMEGLGLGAVMNVVLLGLRGIKGRLYSTSLKAGDEGVEDVAEEVGKELAAPKTAEELLRKEGLDLPDPDAPALTPEGVLADAEPLTDQIERRVARDLEDRGLVEDRKKLVAQGFKSRAAKDLEAIRASARLRLTETTKIEQALKTMDEALARNDDPVEAIRGVVNLGTLDDAESARLLDVFVKNSPDLSKIPGAPPRSLGDMNDRAAMQASQLAEGPPEALVERFRALGLKTEDLSSEYATLVHALRGFAKDINEIGTLAVSGTEKQIFDRLGESASREEVTLLFTQRMDFLRRILGYWRGSRAEWGYTGLAQQRARRWTVGAEEALKVLERSGSFENAQKSARKLAEMMRAEGGADTALGAAQRWDPARAKWNLVHTWYVNSLLSSFKTFGFINVMGNAMTAFWAPTEQLLGARLKKGLLTLSGQSTEEVDGVISGLTRSFGELVHGWRETMAVAREAGRTGDSVLLGGNTNPDHIIRNGFRVDNLREAFPQVGNNLSSEQGFGKGMEALANVVELPANILITQDEFFKQINFRASAAAQFGERGYKAGFRGKELDEWVRQQMVAAQHKGEAMSEDLAARLVAEKTANVPQEARRELAAREHDRLLSSLEAGDVLSVSKRAVKDAEERTFTGRLKDQTHILAGLGASLQKLTLQHPSLKLIVPFIQTPMNILVYAAQRTPFSSDMVGMARYATHRMAGGTGERFARAKNRWLREVTAPDAYTRNEAFSRTVAATGATFTAIGLAASGTITGAGPKDRDMREMLQQSGWQPYSVKVGDNYISYKRLDPVASILGVFADIYDHLRWDIQDAEGAEAAVISTVVSLTDNIRSKSYLQGIADLFGVLEDPERGIPNMAGRIAGGFVVPGAVAQFRDVTDPFLREPQGILQRLAARTPGLSSEIEPHRNILGEAMNRRMLEKAYRTPAELAATFAPLHLSQTSNDTITQELALLEYGFSNPNSKKYGVDLRDYKSRKGQTAYDRWMELTGTVTVGGLRLRDRLSRLINSARYQKLPYEGVEEADETSPRVKEVQKILSRYRAVAEQKMLREYEELQQQARAKVLAQRALALGQSPLAIETRLFPGRQ